MASSQTRQPSEIGDAEKQVAATLAAALIARGFNLPAASNTTMAATQAVDLYRQILVRLGSLGEKPSAA